MVAEYKYDAWGSLLVSRSLSSEGFNGIIHKLNPFRYRGYMYDEESGFYYLRSRYYDPAVSRFINSDGVLDNRGVNTINLFAYCGNNPVNRCDPSGYFWFTVLIVVAVVTIGYHHISKRNKRRNSKVDSNPKTTTRNKIINDQNGATGSNFEYGLHNASWNACETIAVHNAKVLKGIDSTLSETMADFQSDGAMIGFGAFGSNPYAIGKVLSSEGISYSRVNLNEMTETGTYIISFWNDNAPWGGLHTVALSYDGTTYTAYNLKCNGSIYNIDLSNYSESFICGYYLR